MVEIVELHGGVGAPAPDKGLGQGPVIGGIPAHPLLGAGDAQPLHLAGKVGAQGLTHRVAGGIEQIQFGPHAVFVAVTVAG